MDERYEIEAEAAAALMAQIEESNADSRYLDGVKAALGWVLGYYDIPEVAR